MKKILVGALGEKVDRSALGVFSAKKNSRVMEYSDGKCFLIGSDNQKQKIEKEFGKDYSVRAIQKEDSQLSNKKLSDIR